METQPSPNATPDPHIPPPPRLRVVPGGRQVSAHGLADKKALANIHAAARFPRAHKGHCVFVNLGTPGGAPRVLH